MSYPRAQFEDRFGLPDAFSTLAVLIAAALTSGAFANDQCSGHHLATSRTMLPLLWALKKRSQT
jgi:hypothetical protein